MAQRDTFWKYTLDSHISSQLADLASTVLMLLHISNIRYTFKTFGFVIQGLPLQQYYVI